MVAAFGANDFPAIIFQPFEYFPAIHGPLFIIVIRIMRIKADKVKSYAHNAYGVFDRPIFFKFARWL
ncbi:hypothetical protein [Thalassospira sp.]|uniref:hypothetical protein n=1 Tax=Thalassospira sp. TaxID=1912094 RepID=UPI0032EF1F8B